MISWTPSAAGTVTAKLAGDALDGVGGTVLDDGPIVALESDVQSTAPFRGPQRVRFARGHVQATITFRIWKKHATLSAAVAHFQDEPALRINQAGTLVHADQRQRRTFRNGIIFAVVPVERIGISTVMDYRILSDPAS